METTTEHSKNFGSQLGVKASIGVTLFSNSARDEDIITSFSFLVVSD